MHAELRARLAGSGPRDIRSLGLPGGLSLLMLAPHPDDFDAIGVTLKFLADNGHSLHVGVARTGSGVEDAYRPGLTLAGKADLREREQRDSARFFGLPDRCLTFLSLANDSQDQPADNMANRDRVGQFMQEKAPDIVFLPHGNDTNAGHQVIYSLFRQVACRLRQPPAAWLIRDPKTLAMRADLYLPFGEGEARWKAELLRFHDSQHQRNLRSRGHGFDERVLQVNRKIAKELALEAPYAEAFEVELPDGAGTVR